MVACVAHYGLGLDWQLAVLIGAVTSPTDAAAVFSVLRRVPIRPRLRGALEAESGLNDAPTVLLVTLVSTGAVTDKGPWYFFGLVVYELVVGALFGFLVGWVSVGLLRRVALGSAGLYPLAIVSLAVLSYAGGSVLAARVRVRRGVHDQPGARAGPSCRTGWPPGRSWTGSPGWPRSGCS